MKGEIQALRIFRHTEARLMEVLSNPTAATDTTSITIRQTHMVLSTSMLVYKSAYKPPKKKKTRGWIGR